MAVAPGVSQERSAVQLRRQLILTGEIRLRVEEFEAAQSNLTDLAVSYGGFVSDSTREVDERGNETWTRGTVVVRVPRENFTALFEDAQQIGTVQQATRRSEDVTDRLVDLEARLENLRAERDRLRTLYERANTTEDVLEVQERLSEVQGEIERLEARLRSLRNQVAFSTITVHVQEPRPDATFAQQLPWWETPLVRAFLQSVDGVATALRAIGVGMAFVLPYVLVFGAPIAGVVLLYRRQKH
jgi:vacuolar-type H+-ATPase subunit I/STV1